MSIPACSGRGVLPLLMAAAFVPASVRAAELRAGVAKADLAPPIGSTMYGYSARGSNVSAGVHDRLHALPHDPGRHRGRLRCRARYGTTSATQVSSAPERGSSTGR